MKAVICAAGKGSRMLPYTKEYPKALLPIGKKTVIEYLLDNLSAYGVIDVIIVVGHKKDAVMQKIGKTYKNCTITYVHNDDYDTTNNVYSLYLTKDYITDGMIFFNGDIVFNKNILKKLLDSKHPDVFVIDQHISLQDDAMKVHLKDGHIHEIGKQLMTDAHGWAIGIYKLSQEAAEEYFKIAEELFENSQEHKNVSFVVPLQYLAQKRPIKKRKVNIGKDYYPWVEIDTHEDYENAKGLIDNIIT